MQFENFNRIVRTFVDEDNEFDWDGRDGALLLGIRGIEVEAKIKQTPSGIQVEHEDVEWNAEEWIWSYLAKLDRLADRIIRSVSPPPHYVSPSCRLADWVTHTEKGFSDAKQKLQQMFNQHPLDKTLIYFLTSDAGEGKTSLIEKISYDQAEAFKNKETQTLVLPVSLGGRPFLRLDDAVIASLSNRFRFPFLYYDSFIELVKMGVIIPAFDGYEEMIETQSGEAISAIGDLVNQLSSRGTLLVAARKAYFDSSFGSQSRLLDPVRRKQEVDICRVTLDRWSRRIFLKYATKREVQIPPEELYRKVARTLKGDEHPVLTRAVLVSRLLDSVTEDNDLEQVLQRLGQSPTDYFFDFVESIIEREAHKKWVDTSGTKKSSLLTKDEHHDLLSQIAFEMWVNGVETIGLDVVRLVVQIFAEEKNKTPAVLRQINNRISDHCLLRLDDSAGSFKRIRFDHEDFRAFYLGQALARVLVSRDDSNARLILNAHQLSNPVVTDEAARYLISLETSVLGSKKLIEYLHNLAKAQQPVSYIRENCGTLMLTLAERTKITHSISDVNFPEHALEQRKIENLRISNSLFNSTSLSNSEIRDCTFNNCRFVELELNGNHNLSGTVFDKKCSFDTISVGNDFDGEYRKFFNPDKVRTVLKNHGFILEDQQHIISAESDPTKVDEDMKIALRFIRMFARSTVVAENTARTRIGTQHSMFFNNILPKLQKAHLIETISSPGNRSKYRLVVPLSKIDELVENSGSTFGQFIANASNH